MEDINYTKAIELLQKCSSSEGFLASAQNISNYKRVWARDGVICGLAALASGNVDLIATFEKTLKTLARNQHHNGTIPSNVMTNGDEIEVSYGGLAGRVDAVTWSIIGICQYAKIKTLGILTLNNKKEIENNCREFELQNLLEINEDYIFGKYAKDSTVLSDFCEAFRKKHGFPIEPTYTGRMFYGLYDLINQNYFPHNAKIIALHTGGIKLSH